MSATREDIAFGQELRDRIINHFLEWVTGPDIDSRTLAHFRFVAHHFSMPGIARELCDAQSVIARQELAVSLIVTALEIAIDDSPTERQLQRREARAEARAAAKEFEEKLAGLKPAGKEPEPEPVKSPSRSIHNRPKGELTEAQREHVRKLATARMARYRAKLKARKAGNAAESI